MKLEPALQHALAVWRTELGYAAAGEHPSLRESDLASRRVTVIVHYTGDVEALRQAGMQTGFDSGGVISGSIALADLDRLEAVPGVERIILEPRAKPLLDGTVAEMRVPWRVQPSPTPGPGRGAGVIVAVIDTGIDIFHESFRKADTSKTRILELWDQAATTGGTSPPPTFAQIGRVYSAADIETALTADPPFASIDDNGHGTHVAGIAAGDGSQDDRCHFPGSYAGVAPEAALVVVKAIGVPNAGIRDAMRWCAQAGTRHAGNPPVVKPVVINCSFGTDIGPHDGTDVLDGFVDELLRPSGGPPPAGLAIVVAAGNAGDEEIHESGTVAANASSTVSFYMPEDSTKADLLDIWYTGTAALNIEIIAPPNPALPGPNTTGPIPPGAPGPPGTPPGSPYSIGQMSLSVTSSTAPLADHNNKKQINVTITVPANKMVRNGVWQLKLTNTTAVAANWDAWFNTEHGDSYPIFRLPADPAGPVQRRRENTIDSPGNSRNAITVANYDDGNGERNPSSSLGPPNQAGRPAGEIKPTIAAPGTSVAAPRSRDHKKTPSSCCDQLVIDETGTSMAAPHIAGLVALMFEKNRNLTFEQVRGHLQVSGRIDGIPSAEIPPVIEAATGIRGNHLWGSGKVDAAVALAGIPAAAVAGTPAEQGGGGGGGQPLAFAPDELGLTPHNLVSRLADWQRRFGARPGLQLFAALISEHVDEVLRLVNTNRRVTVIWRRRGGPLLVRWLLHGPPPSETLLPRAIKGCDVANLLAGFVAVLDQFAGPKLRADIARFADFVKLWPGGSLARLDQAALAYGALR